MAQAQGVSKLVHGFMMYHWMIFLAFPERPKKYLNEYCAKQEENHKKLLAYRMAHPTPDEQFKAWKAGKKNGHGVPRQFVNVGRLRPIQNPAYVAPGDEPMPTRDDLVNILHESLNEVTGAMNKAMGEQNS